MHEILTITFRERPGSKFVDRGEYSFLWNEGEDIVDSDRWTDVVREGMVFEMAIILRRNERGTAMTSQVCPRCKMLCYPSERLEDLVSVPV